MTGSEKDLIQVMIAMVVFGCMQILFLAAAFLVAKEILKSWLMRFYFVGLAESGFIFGTVFYIGVGF